MSEASSTRHDKIRTALQDSLSSIDARTYEQAGFTIGLTYILHQTLMSTDSSQEALIEMFFLEVIFSPFVFKNSITLC